VTCSREFSGHPALPRGLLCFFGGVVELSSVKPGKGYPARPNVSLCSICVPSSSVSILPSCFGSCALLSAGVLESGSTLSVIEADAFHGS
jgi:hypothetical protein